MEVQPDMLGRALTREEAAAVCLESELGAARREGNWIVCGLILTGLYFWINLGAALLELRDPTPGYQAPWVAIPVTGVAWVGLLLAMRFYERQVARLERELCAARVLALRVGG